MLDSIALSSSVLEALGRLAWSAMNLEDWTNAVCERVLGEFDTHHPIGPHIDSAVAELRTWDQTAATVGAIAWLLEAKNGMIRRNQVVHAVPIHMVELLESGRKLEPALVYFHRPPKSGERPQPTYTVLNEKTLDNIAGSIEETLTGYVAAFTAISAAKAERDGG